MHYVTHCFVSQTFTDQRNLIIHQIYGVLHRTWGQTFAAKTMNRTRKKLISVLVTAMDLFSEVHSGCDNLMVNRSLIINLYE